MNESRNDDHHSWCKFAGHVALTTPPSESDRCAARPRKPSASFTSITPRLASAATPPKPSAPMPEQQQLHGVAPTIFDPSPFRVFSPSSKVYMCTVIFPRVGSSTTTTTMGRTGKNSYATGCSAASPVVTPVVNDSHGACCCWLPLLPSPLSLEPRLPRAAAAALCALLAGRRCPPDEIFTFMGGVSRAAGIRQGRATRGEQSRGPQWQWATVTAAAATAAVPPPCRLRSVQSPVGPRECLGASLRGFAPAGAALHSVRGTHTGLQAPITHRDSPRLAPPTFKVSHFLSVKFEIECIHSYTFSKFFLAFNFYEYQLIFSYFGHEKKAQYQVK